MSLRLFVPLLAGFLIFGLPAFAQSFDCQKATTSVEKMICGDEKLSAKDEGIAYLFNVDMEIPNRHITNKIRDDQKQWLQERNQCTTAQCLLDSYADRNKKLQEFTVDKGGIVVPVLSIIGVDTVSASITILSGWPERVRECESFWHDDLKSCVDKAKKDFKGPATITATANCQTGNFQDLDGRPLFYKGDYIEKNPGSPDITDQTLVYEGFALPDSHASGVWASVRVYKLMCTVPRPQLAVRPPILFIPNCSDALNDAKHALTTSLLQAMHLEIIDTWDVKTTKSVWNEQQCEAKVTLNRGGDLRLLYKIYPRHGSNRVEAQLLQP